MSCLLSIPFNLGLYLTIVFIMGQAVNVPQTHVLKVWFPTCSTIGGSGALGSRALWEDIRSLGDSHEGDIEMLWLPSIHSLFPWSQWNSD